MSKKLTFGSIDQVEGVLTHRMDGYLMHKNEESPEASNNNTRSSQITEKMTTAVTWSNCLPQHLFVEMDELHYCTGDKCELHHLHNPFAMRRHNHHQSSFLRHRGHSEPKHLASAVQDNLKLVTNGTDNAAMDEDLELEKQKSIANAEANSVCWVQRSRWLKFEENFNIKERRFDTAHASILRFHDVSKFQHHLEDLILLDIDETNIFCSMEAIADELINRNLVAENVDKEVILHVLLANRLHPEATSQPHRVQEEDGPSKEDSRSKSVATSSIPMTNDQPRQNTSDDIKTHSTINNTKVDGGQRVIADGGLKSSVSVIACDNEHMVHDQITASQPPVTSRRWNFPHLPHLNTHHNKHHGISCNAELQRCLEPGTEACIVLSGVSNFLRKSVMLLARITSPEGIRKSGLVEVNIPVRFIYMFMGPSVRCDKSIISSVGGINTSYYSAVSRCFAVMVKNMVFCSLALTTHDPTSLIHASNVFMDGSALIPLSRDITSERLGAMGALLKEYTRDLELQSEIEKNAEFLDQLESSEQHKGSNLRSALWKASLQSHAEEVSDPEIAEGISADNLLDKKSEKNADDLVMKTIDNKPDVTRGVEQISDGNAPSQVKFKMRKKASYIDAPNSAEYGILKTNKNAASVLLRMSRAGILPPSSLMHSLDDHDDYGDVGSRPLSKKASITDIEGKTVLSIEQLEKDTIAPYKLDDGLAITADQENESDSLEKVPCCPCSKARCISDFFPPFKRLAKGFRPWLSRIPSDFKDACTREHLPIILSSIVFLYFVLLAPAITFGAILNTQVTSKFTITLTIFSSGVLSLIFSLFSGQPLAIIGVTAPIFIIESSIKSIATTTGLDVQLVRFWVAIYASILGLICLSFNLTSMVHHIRRSVEEIFNTFISFFFILKAVFSMFRLIPYPFHLTATNNSTTPAQDLKDSQNMAIAGTTLFLAFAMLNLCLSLAALKRGVYLRRKARSYLGSFSVPIGIIFVVAMDKIFFDRFNLPTLDVPPSDQVNPNDWINLPSYANLTRIDPAQMGAVHGISFVVSIALTLIVFTEVSLNGITALKNKAVKTGIFEADLMLTMVIFPVICGCLGWPFFSGATVRTMSHLAGLAKYENRPQPGMAQKLIGTVEQRITTMTVSVLLILSVFLGSALRHIPMAALFGMFLYMGVMGLRDLTLFKRAIILLKRRKHWNDMEIIRGLPTKHVFVFSLLELLFVSILVALNIVSEFTDAGAASLVFPIIVLIFGLIRELGFVHWKWMAPYLHLLDRKHKIPSAKELKIKSNVSAAKGLDDKAAEQTPFSQLVVTNSLGKHSFPDLSLLHRQNLDGKSVAYENVNSFKRSITTPHFTERQYHDICSAQLMDAYGAASFQPLGTIEDESEHSSDDGVRETWAS